MGLADKIIAWSIKDKDDISKQLGGLGSVITFFNLFQDSLNPSEVYTVLSTRGLGSSLIIAHPGLGWIGEENAGSIAAGSQPYLGDSRGTFSNLSISSPNDSFIEYFDFSRFRNSDTTAPGWDVESGSLVFGEGSNVSVLTSGLSFDGTGDYVKLPDSQLGSVSLSGLTMEAWVKPTALSNFGKILEVERNDGVALAFGLVMNGLTSGVKMDIRFADESSGSVLSQSGIPLNQWSHLVGQYDNVSGSLALFIDGLLNAAHVVTPQTTVAMAGSPRGAIGATGLTDSNYFAGHIDEMRITEGSVYPDTGFTPSTTELSTTASTLALWHMNSIDNAAGSIVSDAVGVNNGSAAGDVALVAGSVGSSYTATVGSVGVSEDIYLGGSILNTVRITTTGSTTSNLAFTASPDGGTTFESLAEGSTHTFTADGSALRWKAVSSGSAILNRVQADYTWR